MQHKIGCYIRVSTDEQAVKIEGSLDSQKYRLTGFVDLKNMQSNDWGKIVEYYIDDVYTADNSKRPAFKRLLEDIITYKINMILVTDITKSDT